MSFGPPQTPEIIKNLMIANLVVFIVQIAGPRFFGIDVSYYGTVVPEKVWVDFEFWRIFTYMWLHSTGSILHIAFNMFSLWMFGSALALVWGEERFLKYYLLCGVGAGFLIASIPFLLAIIGVPSTVADLRGHTLGASGAVMGILLAYSFTWPDRTIMLIFPPIPVKAKWLAIGLAAFELYNIRNAAPNDNVAHYAHLGGMLVGFLVLRIWQRNRSNFY